MVNFGPLAAEIVSLVWDTPGNFNGFRVLAALLHGTLEVGVSQTAALNRGRHLNSAGRPSRWALAHTLVLDLFRKSSFSISEPVARFCAFSLIGWVTGRENPTPFIFSFVEARLSLEL